MPRDDGFARAWPPVMPGRAPQDIETKNNTMTRLLNADTPCPLCQEPHAEVVSEHDRDRRPLRTVLCLGCGLTRTDPLPDQAAIDAFYRNAYREQYKRQSAPSRRHVLRAGRVALDRIARLPAPAFEARRAVDVGAGGGEFAYLLGRVTGTEVSGVEPHQGYAAHAADALGLNVAATGVLEAGIEPGSLDLVTLYHVLEHLRDPVSALTRIGGWLRPGGTLVVEVPNIEATCQSPGHLFHFAHLFNFNSSTLELAGHLAGLAAFDCWHSPDRGNVCVSFRAGPPRSGAPAHEALSRRLPGNVWRVRTARRSHTVWWHYASGRPLARLAARMSDRLGELRMLQRYPADARALLDRLLADRAARGALRGPVQAAF